MNKKKLEKPTVRDVIELLRTYPPDMPFRIEDADTYWTISIIHVHEEEGAVWFSGEYGEMRVGPE